MQQAGLFSFGRCVLRPECVYLRDANDDPMKDFAAIDFETANGKRTSVCSVGVVVVRGGEVTDTFYRLIRPRPNFYSRFTTAIHGLTYEDTADAPDFRVGVARNRAPHRGAAARGPQLALRRRLPAGRLRVVRHALSRLYVLLHLPCLAPHLREPSSEPPAAHRFRRLRLRTRKPPPRAGRCRSVCADRPENPITYRCCLYDFTPCRRVFGRGDFFRETCRTAFSSLQSPSSSWKRISQRL